ncbi:hypothetical protein HZC53_03585 [Candidatus Uhrbacteria bacterium]|nr:hypothetical protein [Candidatus Uhrbacteria bacterium]
MEKEPTTQDILEAINHFASDVDDKFISIDKRFDGIETDIRQIKATMVTKSYLDDKMADLRGDLVSIVRKEDSKVDTFVKIAADEGAISNKSAQKILAISPFPK